MEKIEKLVNKIKDEKLRKKVLEFIKDFKLTNKNFSKYKPEDIEKLKTPFSVSGGPAVLRDVINHTIAVVNACEKVANVFEKVFNRKVNKDVLIASAILHDLMKAYEYEIKGNEIKPTNIKIDHSILAGMELYKRDFPEEVIHCVVSHLGNSTTSPKTIEAIILHYVDTLMSILEYFIQIEKITNI